MAGLRRRVLVLGSLLSALVLCVLAVVSYFSILHWRMPVTGRVSWVWKLSEGTLVLLQYRGEEEIAVRKVSRATRPTFEVWSTEDDQRLMSFFLVADSRYRRLRRVGQFSWVPLQRPGLMWVRASVPMWLPCGLLLVGPVLTLRRRRIRDVRAAAGECIECGYSLEGLTKPRCPECGTAFAC